MGVGVFHRMSEQLYYLTDDETAFGLIARACADHGRTDGDTWDPDDIVTAFVESCDGLEWPCIRWPYPGAGTPLDRSAIEMAIEWYMQGLDGAEMLRARVMRRND